MMVVNRLSQSIQGDGCDIYIGLNTFFTTMLHGTKGWLAVGSIVRMR